MNNTTVNNWKTTNFGELARFINGYAFKPADWSSNGRQIIRIEQLRNPQTSSDYFNGKLPKDYEVQDGDLIFSWSATLMLRIWNNGNAYLNQHLFKVLEKNNVDRIFLKYLIEYNLPGLINASHGSTMQHITRPTLLNFPVNTPVNLTEQQTIAEILSVIDEAIAKTDQLIAKYKSVKQGLMQDLFRYGIDENGQIRNEKTHKFKDSPLGRIPEEWSVVGLFEAVQSMDGKRFPIKEQDRQKIKGNYPYYGASGIIDWINKYSFNGEYLLLAEDGENILSRNLPIAFIANGKFWVNNHAHVLKPSKDVNIKFLQLFLETLNYAPLNTSSAQPKLTASACSKINILKPTKKEQDRISDVFNSIDVAMDNEYIFKYKLEHTKQGLMNDLLTGKVRVNHLLN